MYGRWLCNTVAVSTRRSPEQPTTRRLFTRRKALELGGATAVSASLLPMPVSAGQRRSAPEPTEPLQTVVDLLRPDIKPRNVWADDLPVTGQITAEEDVRFLLVHHTASTNDYQPEDVAGQIRDFYTFHTGPEKGWPDVAYNFFVDRYGGIWEARAGSIDGPVRGDATGGSQGHALLCSLIGDHSKAEVTQEAKQSMVALLAWLSAKYDVETKPGTSVVFESRGSNRWPTGSEVTARTISGHRDMSQTTCPGDFAYSWIERDLPAAVSEAVDVAMAEVASAVTIVPVEPDDTTSTSAAPQATTTTTTAEVESERALSPGQDGDGKDRPVPIIVGGIAAAGAAVLAGLVRLRNRAGVKN